MESARFYDDRHFIVLMKKDDGGEQINSMLFFFFCYFLTNLYKSLAHDLQNIIAKCQYDSLPYVDLYETMTQINEACLLDQVCIKYRKMDYLNCSQLECTSSRKLAALLSDDGHCIRLFDMDIDDDDDDEENVQASPEDKISD